MTHLTIAQAAAAAPTDFERAALVLSKRRFAEIARLTPSRGLQALRRAANALRRRARGPNKLARRLRRNVALGRYGAH